MTTNSQTLLGRLATRAVVSPRVTLGMWVLTLAAASIGALRLPRVAQGGSEAIRGSESHRVLHVMDSLFGRGAAHAMPVVLTSDSIPTNDPRFANVVAGITASLAAD